jgi:hypothetical protein
MYILRTVEYVEFVHMDERVFNTHVPVDLRLVQTMAGSRLE